MKLLQWLGVAAVMLATTVYAQQAAPAVRVERHVIADGDIAPSRRGELGEAQRALEAAAREVARLSAGMGGLGARAVMDQFSETGRRAMLGITIDDGDGGSLVSGVSPGGPAAESGVKSGALVIGVNGQSLADEESPTKAFIQAMSAVEPGDKVRLRIRQDGKEELVEVTTKAFEPQAFVFAYEGDGQGTELEAFEFGRGSQGFPGLAAFSRPRMRPWADMELVELTPDLGAYFGTEDGLLVVRAPKDNGLDLMDGDVILEIAARKPQNTAHALRILRSFEPGEGMALVIMRKKRQRTINFKIPGAGDNKVSKR